jgi:hypothetical protein
VQDSHQEAHQRTRSSLAEEAENSHIRAEATRVPMHEPPKASSPESAITISAQEMACQAKKQDCQVTIYTIDILRHKVGSFSINAVALSVP